MPSGSTGTRIQSRGGVLLQALRQARRESPKQSHGESRRRKALAAYVVREHRQARSLEEILDDAYLKNRATDEQRLRLLERPEVIRAVGEDTAAMAAERVRETT